MPSRAPAPFSAALLTAALIALAACAPQGNDGPAMAPVPGLPSAPVGYRVETLAPDRSPVLRRLAQDARTRPVTAQLGVYLGGANGSGEGSAGAGGPATPALGARPALTLTLASYAGPVGALAAYNRWFADFGFMAAAQRSTVELGPGAQAERFEVGWPPLHALVARSGSRFLLVEADEAVPAEARDALMDGLLRAALELAPEVP